VEFLRRDLFAISISTPFELIVPKSIIICIKDRETFHFLSQYLNLCKIYWNFFGVSYFTCSVGVEFEATLAYGIELPKAY
jgi:hypothetical protein